MRDVAVVSVGMTPFGELWESSLRQMFVEAATEALNAVGVDKVDELFVGNMSGGQFVGQEHLGPLCADHLGMAGIGATRVESACASGGLALRQGFTAVASGMSDLVLVAGVEKMTDGADVTSVLATAADQENEVYHGITFPGLYAMMARVYMDKYRATEEDMAWVSVKNHRHGAMNPKAQFPREITVDDVLSSSVVAEPLRLLDCSPVSDGAAAVLLCPMERAGALTDRPVKILASGLATAPMALADNGDLTVLDAVVESGKLAYQMAGLGARDIQVAEVHDCFSIAEVLCIEALGFECEGEGFQAAREGRTALGGDRPVNTSGGLKSKGHPVGATGVGQVVEIVQQLREEAGDRQVDGAEIGLTQNMGGSGASSVVHIFQRT